VPLDCSIVIGVTLCSADSSGGSRRIVVPREVTL
jgi:hypothetical protein